MSALAPIRAFVDWQPIETLLGAEHVLLWFEKGERGVGGIECATVFKDGDGPWSYWTHGGPNAGSDWQPRDNERPLKWAPLPFKPR